jgi:hypothetical protein
MNLYDLKTNRYKQYRAKLNLHFMSAISAIIRT